MELNSLEFAKLIKWIAWHKGHVALNKTQLQKLLFICYGLALAQYRVKLFNDDTPKAFPFGPVFPISFKRFEYGVQELTEDEKREFAKNPDILGMIANISTSYCHVTASDFTRWSHMDGSPWHKAVFGHPEMKWGREISEADITAYFNSNWRTGL